ncbi:MAG TPA: hypothetical protein VM055_09005 [Novosphingobium sp.]|nr:hypothetical protein [Novosphingobium sp.]
MISSWPLPMLGFGVAAAAVVWAQAPDAPTYAVPLREARLLLHATELPEGVYGTMPSASPAMAMSDGTLVWKLRVGSDEVLRYTATLTPVDDGHTRVALALTAPPDGKLAARTRAGLDSHPQIRTFYLAALAEQVAATLEKRPYRYEAIMPAMGVAMMSSMGEMSAQMDRAAAELDADESPVGEFGEEIDPGEGSFD